MGLGELQEKILEDFLMIRDISLLVLSGKKESLSMILAEAALPKVNLREYTIRNFANKVGRCLKDCSADGLAYFSLRFSEWIISQMPT